MENQELVVSTKIQEQIQAFGQDVDKVKVQFLQLISVSTPLKEIAQKNPTTLLLGVAKLLSMGLSIDNLDGEGCLVPYTEKDQDTGAITKYAQLQIQWKGYRKLFLKHVNGAKNFTSFTVKKGDVKLWQKATGEMTFTEQFTNNDFEKVQEREELPTIGYVATMEVDETIYGQKNFSLYMSNDDIAKHAQKYSKTKSDNDWYGEKTVAKAVFRKYRHLFKFKDTNGDVVAKDALTYDQSVVHEDNQVEYIDNPESKGKVKVK